MCATRRLETINADGIRAAGEPSLETRGDMEKCTTATRTVTAPAIESAICLLEEVAEFLEDYSDVRDGDDGRPLPNKAMSLLQQVEQEIEALKRAASTATGERDGS